MTEYLAFQCRSRLCLWCRRCSTTACRSRRCFNAARGFVGGASRHERRKNIISDVSMPHAALLVVQVLIHLLCLLLIMFQCRTRLCWWCKNVTNRVLEQYELFQCRTRLCWWCKWDSINRSHLFIVSMPHAALLVVQDQNDVSYDLIYAVSMPHAALLVVQDDFRLWSNNLSEFQCRTRLCWWCKQLYPCPWRITSMFQCRTRLCWWCKPELPGVPIPAVWVSMPHAALLVVQEQEYGIFTGILCGFNAARGFVGGASQEEELK